MDDIKQFLDSFINSDREAIEPRLAFANWLEKQSDDVLKSWGKFIHLQIQTAELPLDSPQRKELIAKEKTLWKQYHKQWGEYFIGTLDMKNITDSQNQAYELNPEWITYDRGIPDFAYRFSSNNQNAEFSNLAYQHKVIQSLLDESSKGESDHKLQSIIGSSSSSPTNGGLSADENNIKAAVSSGLFTNTLQLADAIKNMSVVSTCQPKTLPALEKGLRFMLDYGPDATTVIPDNQYLKGYDTLGAFVALSTQMYDRLIKDSDKEAQRDAVVHVPHPQLLKLLMQAGCGPTHAPRESSPTAILAYMIKKSREVTENNDKWGWEKRTEVSKFERELAKIEESHSLA